MSQTNVLLACDIAVHMAQLRLILENAGYRLTEARTLGDVRRAMARVKPGAVFCDLRIEDATWRHVVKLVAEDSRHRPLLVVVVSPVHDVRLHLDVIEAGAFDLLAAPFCPSDVTALARQAVQSVRDRTKRADGPGIINVH